jgi:hypothetical protein
MKGRKRKGWDGVKISLTPFLKEELDGSIYSCLTKKVQA